MLQSEKSARPKSVVVFSLRSKVSRPEKLAVHLFEVDEDVEKDEVSTQLPECPLPPSGNPIDPTAAHTHS